MAENRGAFLPEVTGTLGLLRPKVLALSTPYHLFYVSTLQVPVT